MKLYKNIYNLQTCFVIFGKVEVPVMVVKKAAVASVMEVAAAFLRYNNISAISEYKSSLLNSLVLCSGNSI